jgi:glycosyltransferase involved in cell wall biosynthesis
MQTTNLIDITFSIPCLNNELTIIDTIDSIREAMKGYDYSYEIIVIDDYSKDNTTGVVREYILDNSDLRVSLIENKKNFGLGYSYVEGAVVGKGKFYKFVHPGNIERKENTREFINSLGEANIISYTIIDNRDYYRRIISRLYTLIVGLVSGYSLKYYGAAGLFLREDVLRFHPNNNGNGFTAELTTILLDNGRSVKEEIEIEQVWTNRGKSKAFSFRNFISIIQGLTNMLCRRLTK